MAATLKGKAIIFAVDGITYSAGITVAGTENVFHQSFDFERSADMSYVKDSAGEDVTSIAANKKKTGTIRAIAGGTAIADARSLADKLLLASNTTVTIVDTETTTTDGSYNAIRSRMNRTNEGAAVFEFEIENRDVNNITSTVS